MARNRCGTCATRACDGRCVNRRSPQYGRYVGYDRRVCSGRLYERIKFLHGVPRIGGGLEEVEGDAE